MLQHPSLSETIFNSRKLDQFAQLILSSLGESPEVEDCRRKFTK